MNWQRGKKQNTSSTLLSGLLASGWIKNPDGSYSAPNQLRNRTQFPTAPSQKKAVRVRGVANRTESRFESEVLVPAINSGVIVRYKFEAVELQLDATTSYLPDYMVCTALGGIEFYEIKGSHVWDDAVVKFKWARTAFPEFLFFMVKWDKKRGVWRESRKSKAKPSVFTGQS